MAVRKQLGTVRKPLGTLQGSEGGIPPTSASSSLSPTATPSTSGWVSKAPPKASPKASPKAPAKSPSRPPKDPAKEDHTPPKAPAKTPSRSAPGSATENQAPPLSGGQPLRSARSTPTALRTPHRYNLRSKTTTPLSKTTPPAIHKASWPCARYPMGQTLSAKLRKSLAQPGWLLKGYVARKHLETWEKVVNKEVDKRIADAMAEFREQQGPQTEVGVLMNRIIGDQVEKEVKQRVDGVVEKAVGMLRVQVNSLMEDRNKILDDRSSLMYQLEDMYYEYYGEKWQKRQMSEADILGWIESILNNTVVRQLWDQNTGIKNAKTALHTAMNFLGPAEDFEVFDENASEV